MEYIKDTLIFDANSVTRKKRLIDKMNELDDDDEVLLPSQLIKETPKKEKKSKEERYTEALKETFGEPSGKSDSNYNVDDDWEMALDVFNVTKSSGKKKKNKFSLEDLVDGKKKKKKKKKDGSMKSHKNEFLEELALLKNLQMDQDKFTRSLQRRYDQLENAKSNARGISKYTTDLIISINNARSTSLSVIDKIISTKAKIADLDFKERKEFGKATSNEQDSMSNYASTYLKEVISAGRDTLNTGSYDYISDSDEAGILDSIVDNLDDKEREVYDKETAPVRDPEGDLYIRYENSGVVVHVVCKDSLPEDSDDKYSFIAVDKNNNIVDDYPLPTDTSHMSINRSTNTATDRYGAKYPLIVV